MGFQAGLSSRASAIIVEHFDWNCKKSFYMEVFVKLPSIYVKFSGIHDAGE